MDKFINEKIAGFGLFTGLLLLMLFHFLVLFKVIPHELTWGGFIENERTFYFAEVFSILLIFFFAFTVAIHLRIITVNNRERLIAIVLKAMFVFFLISGVANVWSLNAFEKLLLAPISFLFSIFAYRLSLNKVFLEGQRPQNNLQN